MYASSEFALHLLCQNRARTKSYNNLCANKTTTACSSSGAERLNDTRLMVTFRLRARRKKIPAKVIFPLSVCIATATFFQKKTELSLLLKSFPLNESICILTYFYYSQHYNTLYIIYINQKPTPEAKFNHKTLRLLNHGPVAHPNHGRVNIIFRKRVIVRVPSTLPITEPVA